MANARGKILMFINGDGFVIIGMTNIDLSNEKCAMSRNHRLSMVSKNAVEYALL